MEKIVAFDEIKHLTGKLEIPMTNDYLFRALLQRNNSVLKALICAVLHINTCEISDVAICNPIELGKSISEKDFILDIKAQFNNGTIINLEMQVVNEHNWVDRSMMYLCREFDRINMGEDYVNAKTVHQVGILNFTLFPDSPEFCANYYLMNEKNHRKYSDKLHLVVIDLKYSNLATDKDCEFNLDTWASFFRCKDWSDIIMLAQKNEDIANAATEIYQLSKDELIRQQCEAREDYYKRERSKKILYDNAMRKVDELTQTDDKLNTVIKEKEDEIKSKEDELKSIEDELKSKEDELKSKEDELKSKEDELKSKDELISKLQDMLSKMDK